MDNWEQIKWLIGFVAAGYAPMVALIWWLLKQLIKAKEKNETIIREVLPLTSGLEDLVENQLKTLIEKMMEKLTG